MAKTYKVGEDSIDAEFIEQDSYNIAYWAQKRENSKILVRLSGFDGLAPVKDDALSKIRRLAEDGDFDALREAGNGLSEDRLYDAANVVYIANRLGIVKEVYWVVPVFDSIGVNDMASFKDYLKGLYPESVQEIDAMTLVGGIIKGRIGGVPVRMLGLKDLTSPGETVLLDMDASYINAMYQNEKDTSSLSFIAGMFKFLSEAGLSAIAVSISSSGEDRRAELRFRSFARYLETLLARPELIGSDPPELWSERAQAWRVQQREPEIAIPMYKNIIERFPDDAASRYDLADLYFNLGELEACAVELESAARLDPGYLAAFTDYRDRLEDSGEPDIAARFYARRPDFKG